MRFKAKLNSQQVSALHSILVSLGRLYVGSVVPDRASGGGTACQLDADYFRIIGTGRSQDTDGIILFVESRLDKIFVDHRIESNAENNKISFEIDISQLKAALKSILAKDNVREQDSTPYNAERYTVIKLAKRSNTPCLCIDACSMGHGAKIQVHHAVPLRLMRPEDFLRHLPAADIPAPTVQLEIPPDLPLPTVVDRLKAAHSTFGSTASNNKNGTLYLRASMKGELDVTCHCDGASLKTLFRQLAPRWEGCADETSQSASTTLKLDTKKLAACLAWPPAIVASSLLCLVENEVLVVHVRLRRSMGTMTYYTPVHYYRQEEHPVENNE